MKRIIQVSLQYGSLAFVIVVSSAACRGQSIVMPAIPPSANSCSMWGSMLSGAQAALCCDGQNPKAPVPDGCPQPPGMAPTAGAMTSFASALASGQAAVKTATQLSVATAAPGALTNVAAATAALEAPASHPGTAAGVTLHAQSGPSSQPGSLVSGRAEGSFGSADLSVASTKPSAPEGAGVSQGGAGKGASDSVAAAYAGGGGGKAAMKSAGGKSGLSDFTSLFGSHPLAGAAPSAAGAQALNFGGRGPTAEEGAGALSAGAADPQDYFSRLKPQDSLFKIVEKRYGVHVQSWAIGDAKKTADSVKKSLH